MAKSKRNLSNGNNAKSNINSNAAQSQLQQANAPLEDESYIPETPGSVTYSVGEDTTILYPSVNRRRLDSRDNALSV